jgi:hypothetical protein
MIVSFILGGFVGFTIAAAIVVFKFEKETENE